MTNSKGTNDHQKPLIVTKYADPPKNVKYGSLRNLAPYKNLTDEEFIAAMDRREQGISEDATFELRIANKLKEFEIDYDLSDMKINDKEVLRSLMQALISLEDTNRELYKVRKQGLTDQNIFVYEKLSDIAKNLMKSISEMQNDLKITRKVRKGDTEANAITALEDMKLKARKFYESKLSMIICPKCNKWIASVWTLHPETKNTFTFTCGCDSGEKDSKGNIISCGETFKLTSKELYDNKGGNRPEILPESLR